MENLEGGRGKDEVARVSDGGAEIRRLQRSWAQQRGIALNAAGYTESLRDNLFQELTVCARREFEAGDGSELGRPDSPGKMQAVHSSSALACNVFDYWRGRDTGALREALRLPSGICGIEFERKFPTGIGPRSSNLDIALECADGTLAAVESKFCEPYGPCRHRPLSDKYFPSVGGGRWTKCALPRC